MATPVGSPRLSLLGLPRELRDEIIGHLTLPALVYTSSDRVSLPRFPADPKDFVDTRIYLPCRISPNALAVCRQLREECLQYHNRTLASLASSSPTVQCDPSSISSEREGKEDDIEEEAERLGDRHVRITMVVQKASRGPFGYVVPAREELSPRFLNLLPLMQSTKKLRLVVWAGVDWWNGARPRAFVKVNGRMKIDESAPLQPDLVSVAIGKVLEHLPAVEELEVELLAHVGELSRWDLPELAWANIQYWLDGPIVRGAGQNLKNVKRRLAGVWNAELVEAIYEQQETRVDGDATWHVKRHGDMRTVSRVGSPVLMDPANSCSL
jgi:hypothetical protein